MPTDMPNWFVVCMGVGTVFIGLICIVVLCKIMSFVCGLTQRGASAPKAAAPAAGAPAPDTANRQEIIAAVSAVAAEELGTDISAIRILSFKKL